MNRAPSTTVAIPKNQYSAFPKRHNGEQWRAMFSAMRDAFGNNEINGLIHVSKNRAFFQETGNATVYSILLTESELAMFHPAIDA